LGREAGAKVGLVDEHAQRGVALGKRVELTQELDDGFGLSPAGQLREEDAIGFRGIKIDVVRRHPSKR